MSLAEILALLVTIAIMGIVSFFGGYFGVELTKTGIIRRGNKFRAGGAVILFGYIMGIGFFLHIINVIIYKTATIYLSQFNPLIELIIFFTIIIIIVGIIASIVYLRRHRRRR